MVSSAAKIILPSAHPGITPIGAGGILQIPRFASPDLCALWTQIIKSREDGWIERADGAWSFGNAWYFDIEAGLVHCYYANAMKSNRMLKNLPQYVETMLQAVRYIRGPDDQICLETRARHENLGPYWVESGLHIYAGDYGIATEVGVAHQDTEGLMPYPSIMFDEKTRAYSAVLSVAAPESKGGLNVWPKRIMPYNGFPDLSPNEMVALDYQVGTMTIIDSYVPHQIQDIICSEKNPLRITAVMHFLYLEKPYPHWEFWF